MLLQVLISCRSMRKYTSKRSQRCDGSNAQDGGSNRRRKSQENRRKKREFCLAPHRSPGASLGRKNRIAHQTCTIGAWGRPWAPPGPHSAAKIQIREFRVSTPYISFLTPPKPLSKPHLHENKVAMLGFTQNLSNPLIPLPFP